MNAFRVVGFLLFVIGAGVTLWYTSTQSAFLDTLRRENAALRHQLLEMSNTLLDLTNTSATHAARADRLQGEFDAMQVRLVRSRSAMVNGSAGLPFDVIRGSFQEVTHDPVDVAWCALHPAAMYCRKQHMVVQFWDEDPRWVKDMFPDWTFTFYNHMDMTSINYLAPNQGREAHGFIKFIVDHYDSLPERTVFMHGLPNADVFPSMRCIPDNIYFHSLTNFWCPNRRHVGGDGRVPFMKTFEALFKGFRSFKDLEQTSHYCCANFVASRQAILDVPLAFWKRALWVAQSDKFRSSGYSFEEVWHVIFHQPTVMTKVDWCAKDRFPCECDRKLLGEGLHPWFYLHMDDFFTPVYMPFNNERGASIAKQMAQRYVDGKNMPPNDFDW